MRRWTVEVPPVPIAAPPQDRILRWLQDLRELRHVPLGYLVPDARMLPSESLRFFALDEAWLDALCDGALSIGHAAGQDAALREAAIAAVRAGGTVTGFMLRSVAVWRWPTLQVLACDADGGVLQPIRLDRPAPDIMLGLYPGALGAITVSEPPEAQHFGFHDGDGTLQKAPRVLDGGADPASVGVPLRAGRVVDVGELKARLEQALGSEELTPATFALQLVQGVERVHFGSDGTS